MNNQTLVAEFIEQIWNQQNFHKLENFLHPDFTDHSLPPSFPQGAHGLKKWILATNMAFEHKTIIEDQVTEGNKSVIRLVMQLKHTGEWRGIAPTGIEIATPGYRFYKIKDGKIIESRALIDGETIENQLKSAKHGCVIE